MSRVPKHPKTHRQGYYRRRRRAVRILLANGKAPGTVCGMVRNIGREGQESRVLTLAALETTPVDMFTTVFVGNAQTRQLSGRMVTPRGYRA